ncbi:MAG: hypothetical protein BroJett029_23250 [Alphaproteobacteria bacterium]|nr:MAG: hypothetical protein BroJett029_23250 [Alphaproteobacteria bacterium]
MSVEVGERVGLIGRNGAGKTTLLKLITGNFLPTSGTITVLGRVQALMQTGLGFHPEFTGLQNIRSSVLYNGLSRKQAEQAVEDVIDFCELGDFLERPLRTYSLGMQSRLQFAVATAVEPEILLIDEVLGSGDLYFSAKSAERLERLAFSGCTLLVVSHDMSQVLKFCNRAVWIEQGQIAMDAQPQEVVNAYEVFTQNLIVSSISGQRQAPAQMMTSPWLMKQIGKKEERGSSASDTELGTALKQRLDDGQEVYRWPGKAGVKFSIIRVNGENGGSVVARGERLALEYLIRVEPDFASSVMIYASIFGRDGERKAWLTSSSIAVNGHERPLIKVTCVLDPVLLGAGEYLLSTSLFTAVPPTNIDKAERFDLVSRCLHLKVIDFDQRSPAVFHHPSTWTTEDGKAEHL